MSSSFRDFSALVLHLRKDKDYRLHIENRSSEISIIAIHGGGIEPLTSELAGAVAGGEYNLYDLQGLRSFDNAAMRIPIARFDEMRLRGLLERSHTALSIDGVPGDDLVVHLGGRNRRLKAILNEALGEAGFECGSLVTPGAAHHPQRFYNLTRLGGLHLELPYALRRKMVQGELTGFGWQEPEVWTQSFGDFVKAVRGALEAYLAVVQADLDLTMERFEKATRSFPASLRRDKDNHHH
jgi:phage replication-related protein YjqB (UPF0714/DUF867 family)